MVDVINQEAEGGFLGLCSGLKNNHPVVTGLAGFLFIEIPGKTACHRCLGDWIAAVIHHLDSCLTIDLSFFT